MKHAERQCSRKGCQNISAVNMGSSTFYCRYHQRSSWMRVEAKRRGKYCPTPEEVDALFAELIDMRCPICMRVMVLHSSLGAMSTVASLQHDNDGTLRIICHGCNAAHSKLGDIIYDIPKGYRRCSICKTIKITTEFPSTKTGGSKRIDSRCSHCKNESRIMRRAQQKLIKQQLQIV